jgi:phosphohistidine phosphatase SixA
MRPIVLALVVMAASLVPPSAHAAPTPAAQVTPATPEAPVRTVTPTTPVAAAPRDTSVTTVIVVRHAEKNTAWVGDDPPLTEAGTRRAQALAHALADAHVDRIWVTRFLRNRATALPLAELTRDSIEVVDQGAPSALAERAWQRERGRTILIVGHSDTVPAIVASLTGGPAPALQSGQFDALFVISRRGSEPVHMLRLRYGEP